MGEKVKSSLEKFSKAIVQPLMYLAVAGTLLIIGILFTSPTLTKVLPFLQSAPFALVGSLIYKTLMFLINNLGLIFCVGIAGALAKKEKGHAALVALMSYFIFLNANNITLEFFGKLAQIGPMGLYGTGQATVLGIQVLDSGVFSGILIGCLCGFVFNKNYSKQFKGYFAMYSGVRFAFLLMILVSIFLGFGFTFIWPIVQMGIGALTSLIKDSGNFGLYIYGVLNKILVPTGLHHLVYAPFMFSDVGGTLALGDQIISGSYGIRVAEMAMEGVAFSDSTYYNSYTFNNLFPYIGICLAFVTTARKENRNKTKSLILPLMMTAVLSAITEPIDFLFVFTAPLLFVIHSLVSGVFLVLLKVFSLPAATSGGIINVMFANLAVGVDKTRWPYMLLLGLVCAAIYYTLFVFLIKKFSLRTPGREVVVADTKVKDPNMGTETQEEESLHIIKGLGGKENIVSVDNCFTRLRVNVVDETLVNEDYFNKVKHSGIKRKDKNIQIIFGIHVPQVKEKVEEALEKL